MGDFKSSTADSLTLANPASSATQAVRKGEVDTALADKASNAALSAAITANTHAAATANNTGKSVAITVAAGQVLSADVTLVADTTDQAALLGRTNTFASPVAAGTLALDKLYVSNLSIVQGGTTYAAIDGTDYFYAPDTGVITIPAGSPLVAAHPITVTFDCAQVISGAGMEKVAGGLQALWGTSHSAVARGDHRHTNDHKRATVNTGNQSITLTIDQYQKISAEVRLATSSNLAIVGTGLKVDMTQVAAFGHAHDLCTTDDPGFMSADQFNQLEALVASTGGATYTDTASVTWTNGAGLIHANARVGSGLAIDGTGIKVDFTTTASLSALNAVSSVANAALPKAGGTMSGALTITGLAGVLKATLGVVSGSATTSDLSEGTNLYFTNARADTRADGRISAANGAASGICPLGADSKIPITYLPPLAINDTTVVASQAAMLALTAQRGDLAIRSDTNQTFSLSTDVPATLANWKEVLAIGKVSSVNTFTGIVVLDTDDIAEGSTNIYYTTVRAQAAALAALLTGFVDTGGGVITAADSVLDAIGKTEYRLTTLENANIVAVLLTGFNAVSGGTLATTDSIVGAFSKVEYRLNALGATSIIAAPLTGFASASGGTIIATDTILEAFGRTEFRLAAIEAPVSAIANATDAADVITQLNLLLAVARTKLGVAP
jgi:hypothetical protein